MVRFLTAAAAAAVATLALAAVASAGFSAKTTLIYSGTPFSGCTADNAAQQSGTNYAGGIVEPMVAVNPANANTIVTEWQQDRWSDGGSRGLVLATTTNAGKSWSIQPLATTRCGGGDASKGGDYDRATDPWVSYGPDGNLYVISQTFDDFDAINDMVAQTSLNNGGTFDTLSVLIHDTQWTTLNDKISVTASPTNAGTAWATWDRLVFPKEQANLHAAENAFGYHGPTYLSTTTNGGASWATKMIYDPGDTNQTIGNQIVVLPNGTLVDVFDLIYNFKNAGKLRGYNVAVIRSTDGGATWSGPIVVSPEESVGVPNTRTGDIIPEIAVSPTGKLAAVWQDARFNGFAHDDVVYSESTDGGLSWSSPVRISEVPTAPSFTPMVAFASDGTAGVTYYDERKGGTTTDYWFTSCKASCSSASSWTPSLHLGGPFDMATAPVAGGYFVGDYEALRGRGTGFASVFVQAGPATGTSSPYLSLITP